MSILLESINNKSKHSETDVSQKIPNLNDLHFDDELMSDEWILKKIQFWKLISLSLFFVLLISWVLFYFIISEKTGSSKFAPDDVVDIKVESKEKTQLNELSKLKAISKLKEPSKSEELTGLKKTYTPEKINLKVTQKTVHKAIKNINDKKVDEQIVEFETLSKDEKLKLPNIEINSYAVSSNKKKSFVVLNGKFYTENETIAPQLTLRKIEKNSIVLQYKNRLIRKKYHL